MTRYKKESFVVILLLLLLVGYCYVKGQTEYPIEDRATYDTLIERKEGYLENQVIGENESTQAAAAAEEQQAASDKAQEQEEKKETAEGEGKAIQTASQADLPVPLLDLSRESLNDYDYLVNNFFIVDGNTATNSEQINASALLDNDLTMEEDGSVPQILIYHSHASETFVDSDESNPDTTILGVGAYLQELLENTYGYQVIHLTDVFDMAEGTLNRNNAYTYSREKVEQVLQENPTVEVTIDLHRDGVAEERHLVTEINGKPTAQIMYYNGLSYSSSYGAIDYLPNPYIQDNLSFSLQLQMQGAKWYPGWNRNIYLAALRYNLHLRPRALLVEVGAQTNTVGEAKNAMEPFADVLDKVLKGE